MTGWALRKSSSARRATSPAHVGTPYGRPKSRHAGSSVARLLDQLKVSPNWSTGNRPQIGGRVAVGEGRALRVSRPHAAERNLIRKCLPLRWSSSARRGTRPARVEASYGGKESRHVAAPSSRRLLDHRVSGIFPRHGAAKAAPTLDTSLFPSTHRCSFLTAALRTARSSRRLLDQRCYLDRVAAPRSSHPRSPTLGRDQPKRPVM